METNKETNVKKFTFISSLFSKVPQLGTLVAFVLIVVLFGVLSPVFLSLENIFNIFNQTTIIIVTAFGMTMVLLAGGIDLSIGGIMALVGVSAARLMESGYPSYLVVIFALAIGMMAGLVNGLIITKWNAQPFLITLGTMGITRGLSYFISDGKSIFVSDQGFRNFFSAGKVFGVPSLIIWVIVMLVITYFIVSKTTFGRRLQAIGGNEEAAFISGIRVKKVKIIVYVLSGLFACLGGLILLSRLSTGLPVAGKGAELDAIAACVLGGTGFKGEGGNIFGTLLGSLVIGTVINGLTILGVNPYLQETIKGGIIIVTVVVSLAGSKKH